MGKAKRTLKFVQGIGYGTLTVGAALGTVTLAVTTVALCATGIGTPVGLLAGAGAVGCGAGTVVAGKRTFHKFGRAFERSYHAPTYHPTSYPLPSTNLYCNSNLQPELKGAESTKRVDKTSSSSSSQASVEIPTDKVSEVPSPENEVAPSFSL